MLNSNKTEYEESSEFKNVYGLAFLLKIESFL